MNNESVYIRQNVKLEPLFFNWYAWSYLMAPVTCAKLLVKHTNLMRSYLSAPEIHYQAASNVSLLGGSFIGVPPNDGYKVKMLLDDMLTRCDALINLTQEFERVDFELQKAANGQSLEPMYQELPEALKGCVELVYDYNNHALIRLIEPLLYKKYYQGMKEGQSIVLSETITDERAFSFSTPRFPSKTDLHLQLPYNSSIIDVIAKAKSTPIEYNDLYNILSIDERQHSAFHRLITEDSSPSASKYTEEGVRIRYFGHACILLETKDVTILIDPLINYAIDGSAECFTLADLPEQIDYVFLTHAHQDHVVLETLLQIRYKINAIVVPSNCVGSFLDPSLKLLLQHAGFNNVLEMKEFDVLGFPGGEALALPFLGEHADVNILSKMAYAITVEGKKLVFVADSNNISPDLYRHVYDYIADVDCLFLGMECEGAPLDWFFKGLIHNLPSKPDCESRRFSGSDSEKGWKIIQDLACKEVVLYAMAMEPWLTHIMAINYSDDSPQIIESNKLMERCRQHDIPICRPFKKMEKIL